MCLIIYMYTDSRNRIGNLSRERIERACKTKRPLVLREFAPHRSQNAAVSTCHLWHLYLKDRSGSCGTILEKPWVYENVDEKHVSHFI